jgi:NitT/TauT family transport system substrate-binding protein
MKKILFIGAALVLASVNAKAADKLKLAIGAPGNWDSCISEVGIRAGIFQKNGLELETLYTQGGGETMQAVISGSADIGISAGTAAVLGAFAKGAPVRILAAGTTGTRDQYWYVPAASPIKTFSDTAGKTVAYSTNGASSHTTLLALIKTFNVEAKPIATGAGAVTYTQVVTGQVDVGWAAPPFGLEPLAEGKIRIIAHGTDAPTTRNQTVRVHIVNADALKSKADAIARYMKAYRETYAFLYDNPEGVKVYAQYAKVSEALAVQIRDEFLPKQALSPDAVSGLDAITADAITFKVLAAPLTPEQTAEMIKIPAP